MERCIELRWRREDHRQNLKRLEKEIGEARAFQQSLLPDRQRVLNGVSICCRYTPCSALGGDLYDYADATAGRTALLIADVSGHGVSAAMLTGIVKSAFHASHVDGFEPAAVVQRVSAGLASFSADRFVTLIAALIAPHEGHMRYVNAGHPPIVWWGAAREPTWLESTGPLVSPAFTAATWDVAVVPITAGDHFLLYTDGIWEVLADDEGRAEQRLLAAIARAPAGGAQLLDTILGEVHGEMAGRLQPDDLTMLTASLIPDR